MAKVKFALNYNGNQIRSIEELRENFAASVVEIVADYRSGLLERWLDARWLDDEREKVLAIKSNDDCEILAKLMEIFGVELDSDFISDAEKNPAAAALVRGVIEIFEQERREREERERREREEQERRAREEQERREREEQERREREEQERPARVERGKQLLAKRTFLELCGYCSAEDVKCAIEAGVDVNAKNNDGVTALMVAAINNTADAVNALISAGADVNAKDNGGWTALMRAADHNTADVVNALIQAGADVNAKNNDGWRARDYAHNSGRLQNTDALKRL